MNAKFLVVASGSLALWIVASSVGCSAEPTSAETQTPTTVGPSAGGASSTSSTSSAVGTASTMGGAASGMGGVTAASSAVASSTAAGTASSGLGGVSAVASTASVTTASAGGASSTVSAGGASTEAATSTGDGTTGATTGGDATLTDDQCSGISNGSACETEGVCAPRACGLADTGTRTCTCASAVWDCTSCAWTEPYDPIAEPPTDPLPACAGTEADGVACETSADRCDNGEEVCACYDDDGELVWDCDDAPSFWP